MMRLLSSLLLSIFLAQQVVEATPIPKRAPKSVTLPLNRHKRVPDVHPSIALQQQLNRAERRYARMTGREGPSDDELTRRLQARIDILHERGEIDKLDARYTKIHSPRHDGAHFKGADVTSFADTGGRHKHAGGAKAAAAAAAAGAGTGVVAGAASNAGNATSGNTASTGSTASGAASSSDIGGPSSGNGEVTVSNAPATANSLALDIEDQDVSYSATLTIGTPPQPFLILMDSGSADFWVGGENCVSETGGDCGTHQFLGTQSSSSFADTNKPFQVTYGSGAVAGTIITDDVNLGDLKLPGHTFGVATQESVQFSDNGVVFDGLMGLAQSTLSQQGVLTPVEALAKNGDIPDAIITYRIPRVADAKKDGQITFGALDTTLFDAATLVTVDNVSKDGFWEAAVDATTVDGQAPAIQGKRTAILDTGTTLIIMPDNDAAAVLSLVDGAQFSQQAGFVVPCNTQATLAFTFGGKEFKVQPEDLATGQQVGGGMCVSGIQNGNVGANTQWLVGDVFLKNAIFSTDVGKNTLSLAIPN